METERPRNRRVLLVHVWGVGAFAVCVLVALVAYVVVSFGTSYCGTPTAEERAGIKLGVGIIAGVLALVPFGIAYVAARVGTAWWPWVVVGGVVVLIAIGGALTAEPTAFCLF